MPSRRAASGALRRPFPCGSKKALHEAPARRAARPSVTPRSRSIPGKVTLGDSIVYGNTAKLNGGLAQSACAAKGLHENMRCILVITYPKSLGILRRKERWALSWRAIARERTYSSAVALRDWFRDHDLAIRCAPIQNRRLCYKIRIRRRVRDRQVPSPRE